MGEEQEAKQDKLDEVAENKMMAEVHAQRRQAKLDREINDKAKHVDSLMSDPRMREDVPWEVSPYVPGKLINYKRLSPEEAQDGLNMNAQLVLENMIAKDKALEEEAGEARRVKTQMAARSALEERKQMIAMQKRNEMVEHNKMMAEQKKAKDARERRAHKSFDIVA